MVVRSVASVGDPAEEPGGFFVEEAGLGGCPAFDILYLDAHILGVDALGQQSEGRFPAFLDELHELLPRDHVVGISVVCLEGNWVH